MKHGKQAVRTVKRARILLKAADDKDDSQIMEALGVSRQCLDCMISDRAALKQQATALDLERNGRCATLNWQFTSTVARTKLHVLYLSHSNG